MEVNLSCTRSLDDCFPALAAAVRSLIGDYQATYPTRVLKPICVFRTVEDQQKAFAAHLSQFDGVIKRSKHQELGPTGDPRALAVDLGVFSNDGRYLTNVTYYDPLIALCLKYGLTSGADWNRDGERNPPSQFTDPDHVEWTGELA